MKRVLAIVMGLALAPLAVAQQLYKYTDKDGKTVYTDQPPVNADAKRLAAPPPPPTPAASAKAAVASKTAVERDKEAEKGREQAKEAAKKQEDAAKRAQLNEQRCSQAKLAVQQFSSGGRLMKFNEKGERVYMGDDEIAKARSAAEKDVEEACKG